MRRLLISLIAVLCLAGPSAAEFSALARVDAARLTDTADGLSLDLTLSRPVPWRVGQGDGSSRLILDLDRATWPRDLPEGARAGLAPDGASRLVVDLPGPMAVARAWLEVGEDEGGAAVLRLRLVPSADAAAPTVVPVAEPADPARDGRLVVAIDPGHGGKDPGAEVGGLREADLMLTFARELREVLLRAGGFDVVMTREDDSFVRLSDRLSRARAGGAEVFLSLHADSLHVEDGHASGAAVYTLPAEARAGAARALAAHNGGEALITGVDLSGAGDDVAVLLMELAGQHTGPRSEALAAALIQGMGAGHGSMNSNPHREAALSVLRAPDIPSVLVELGFLSSAADRDRIGDPVWRAIAAEGIRDGLAYWGEAEGLRDPLR